MDSADDRTRWPFARGPCLLTDLDESRAHLHAVPEPANDPGSAFRFTVALRLRRDTREKGLNDGGRDGKGAISDTGGGSVEERAKRDQGRRDRGRGLRRLSRASGAPGAGGVRYGGNRLRVRPAGLWEDGTSAAVRSGDRGGSCAWRCGGHKRGAAHGQRTLRSPRLLRRRVYLGDDSPSTCRRPSAGGRSGNGDARFPTS